MAKTKFELAKGVVDWYGEDAILRNKIRDSLRGVFERYGYNPVETPIIERVETLGFKGGGEIQKEVFRLQDQGSRYLALRFDHTVPLGRFMASHPEVLLPFKRYSIGEVFRDGPTQPEQGRYRTFGQCDIDVLGIKEMSAEAELLVLARDAFKELGLGDVSVRINNRKLLNGVLDYAGIPEHGKVPAIISLDKLDKIGLEGVKAELLELPNVDKETGQYSGLLLTQQNVDKLLEAINKRASNEETFKALEKIIASSIGKGGLEEIQQLLNYSRGMNLGSIEFDPSLARGLDYYTGTTIEVYLQDKSIVKSAIVGGGRYDNMIGDFRGGKVEIPAVGFSFGLERVAMIIKAKNQKVPPTNTQIYLIPMGTELVSDALAIATLLREKGLNVDLNLTGRGKLGQHIKYADNMGIPYVGIIGSEEMKNGMVTLKALKTGQQFEIQAAGIPENIKYFDTLK